MGFKFSPQLINKLKAPRNFYMLGKLAPISFKMDRSCVDIGYDSVKFEVKVLTDDSKSTKNLTDNYIQLYKDNYIGFDNYLSNIYNMPYNLTERGEFIEKELKDKLILFKPNIVVRNEIEGHKAFKNMNPNSVKVISKVKFFEQTHFERIPKVNIKLELFARKIYNREYIEFPEYDTDLDSPRYIYCNGILFNFNSQDWEPHNAKLNTWRYVKPSFDLRACKFDEVIKELTTNYAIVLPTDVVEQRGYFSFQRVMKELSDEGTSDALSGQLTNALEGLNDPVECKELDFVNSLRLYCESRHLSYYNSDLLNFHTCVKSNLLTIIAGPTGTGKSALSQAYAHMLDTSEANGNLLFMPVSPSYLQPEDVLGFFDLVTHSYKKAECGLVDFLISAEQNPDKLYIAIFDEMNLSQIELWFAPFLSLMERDENDRYLTLHNVPELSVPQRIKIGTNVRFIGTINQDETTKVLSDRLLDRVDLVTLQQVKFSNLVQVETISVDDTCISKNVIDKETYDAWVISAEIVDVFDKNKLKFFDDLQNVLSKISACKRLSFRSLKAMAKYIKNLPKGSANILSEEDALDTLLYQRVLSKIRGAELLPNSMNLTEEEAYTSCELLQFLGSKQSEEISHFNLSKQYLKDQIREVCTYGYNY